MSPFSEEYLQKYFDKAFFFRPQCKDKRIRETMQRRKICKECPGLKDCSMLPDFWMAGEEKRIEENKKLLSS